jgi:hypothetical protein
LYETSPGPVRETQNFEGGVPSTFDTRFHEVSDSINLAAPAASGKAAALEFHNFMDVPHVRLRCSKAAAGLFFS